MFMQDNASIHCSKLMKEWFELRSVNLPNHPALSSDLNPIENCWGMLPRFVYAEGRQYQTVEQLKSSIKDNWEKIEPCYLQKLVDSMPTRLRDVLLSKGRMTKY